MKITGKIFGKKNVATFDYWSLAHIFNGYLLSLYLLRKMKFYMALITMFGLGAGWELMETGIEALKYNTKNKTIKKILKYKERESCLNRCVGDIASDMAGFFLAYTSKRKNLIKIKNFFKK